jgi:adenylosuccinate synthase
MYGQTVSEFPAAVADLEKCRPVYETLDGWQQPTSNIREYDSLPLNARKYIQRLEELCDCPVRVVSVGPRREQTIVRSELI